MPSDIWKCYNFFQGRSEQRILNWRNYRQHLTENHLSTVASDWSQCPVIGHYLEPDNNRHWPDPWQLISSGIYCDVSRALGMFYTLCLSDYRHRNSLMLVCYKDMKNHQLLNLVISPEEKYMLNYSLGSLVNISTIDNQLQLINSLTVNDFDI